MGGHTGASPAAVRPTWLGLVHKQHVSLWRVQVLAVSSILDDLGCVDAEACIHTYVANGCGTGHGLGRGELPGGRRGAAACASAAHGGGLARGHQRTIVALCTQDSDHTGVALVRRHKIVYRYGGALARRHNTHTSSCI